MAKTGALATHVASHVEERLLARNPIVEEFFSGEAFRLAEACQAGFVSGMYNTKTSAATAAMAAKT